MSGHTLCACLPRFGTYISHQLGFRLRSAWHGWKGCKTPSFLPSALDPDLSRRKLTHFLRFQCGCHSLPNIQGRRLRLPRYLRHCLHCPFRLCDEQHMMFERPAVVDFRQIFSHLFDYTRTMHQIMRQQDLHGVALFVCAVFLLHCTSTYIYPIISRFTQHTPPLCGLITLPDTSNITMPSDESVATPVFLCWAWALAWVNTNGVGGALPSMPHAQCGVHGSA